jgi:hypothetical protein
MLIIWQVHGLSTLFTGKFTFFLGPLVLGVGQWQVTTNRTGVPLSKVVSEYGGQAYFWEKPL